MVYLMFIRNNGIVECGVKQTYTTTMVNDVWIIWSGFGDGRIISI